MRQSPPASAHLSRTICDWLNAYANYDMAAGEVCDELEVDLQRADGGEEAVPYTPNAAEKEVMLLKMAEYCQRQTQRRDKLTEDVGEVMRQLVTEMQSGTLEDQRITQLMTELAQRPRPAAGPHVEVDSKLNRWAATLPPTGGRPREFSAFRSGLRPSLQAENSQQTYASQN